MYSILYVAVCTYSTYVLHFHSCMQPRPLLSEKSLCFFSSSCYAFRANVCTCPVRDAPFTLSNSMLSQRYTTRKSVHSPPRRRRTPSYFGRGYTRDWTPESQCSQFQVACPIAEIRRTKLTNQLAVLVTFW